MCTPSADSNFNRQTAKTKTNAYTSECNLLDSKTLKYSAYFKECLWTADSFTADAKRGQTVTVNTEKFHAATIYVTCDDQTLIEGITATADLEFKGNTFNNKTYETIGFVYGVAVPMTFNLSCPHKNTELRNKKDATYTEDGYTGDTYCLDCGEKIEEGTSVPKLIAVFEDSSLSQKTEDETITSVKGRTIEELLAQASPTSYITNEYGFILEKDALCYTGCILFLPDGTTLEIAVLGDIAADGLIMADDARMTLRKAVNLESLSAIQSLAADITGDGKIMADDARMILRAAVSLENTETWLK